MQSYNAIIITFFLTILAFLHVNVFLLNTFVYTKNLDTIFTLHIYVLMLTF